MVGLGLMNNRSKIEGVCYFGDNFALDIFCQKLVLSIALTRFFTRYESSSGKREFNYLFLKKKSSANETGPFNPILQYKTFSLHPRTSPRFQLKFTNSTVIHVCPQFCSWINTKKHKLPYFVGFPTLGKNLWNVGVCG